MKRNFCLLFFLWFANILLAQSSIPRPEYPRPQFERADWVNLNGIWTFEFDFGKSGMDRKLFESKGFGSNITVPFCPESTLSGVGHKNFIPAMWYHRTIKMPVGWQRKEIILHFGAVDYYAHIYIDGKSAGNHWGGSSSFELNITSFVSDGLAHELVVYVEDNQRNGTQARGKQSDVFYSQGCDYTRTTGIWQTVWMEAVDPCGLKSVYIVPDLDQKRFVVNTSFFGLKAGQRLLIKLNEL